MRSSTPATAAPVSAEVGPVEGADGVLCGARVLHLDEGEAARAAGLAVGDDGHRVHGAVLLEEGPELVLTG